MVDRPPKDCSPTLTREQRVGKIIPVLPKPREQFCDIATGCGSFVGIAGAERDNVASKIGVNGAAKQSN